MKKSSRLAALKIAQILEEHTPLEISEAVSILKNAYSPSDLIEYLYAQEWNEDSSGIRADKNRTAGTKPIEETTSKAVREIKNSDPEKYQILSRLDQMVRSGQVLETNDSLRRFGEAVSKNFRARASKKENISALISSLSQMSFEDLEIIVARLINEQPKKGSNEYHNLAEFLIKGKKSPNKNP